LIVGRRPVQLTLRFVLIENKAFSAPNFLEGAPMSYEPVGWEFESLQARQLSKLNQSVSAASPSSGFGAVAASLTALAFGGDELID